MTTDEIPAAPTRPPSAPDELRALRRRLGLSQAQLAELLDITPRAVKHYEGGSRPISRVVGLACLALVQRSP